MNAKVLAATLAMLTNLLVGCGLGTEVGNGLKPKKNPVGNGTAPSPKNKQVSDSTTEPDKDKADAGSVPNSESNSSGSMARDDFGFPGDYLVASCASPFAENFASPATFRISYPATLSSNTLTVTRDSNAWLLRGEKGIFRRSVAALPSQSPFAVNAYDEASNPVGRSYSCSRVETFQNIDVSGLGTGLTQNSFTLKDGETTRRVVWLVQPSVTGQNAVLLRIAVYADATLISELTKVSNPD